MTVQNLKAISLKRLVGATKPPEKGSTVWLALVYGVVTSAATKMKDTGTHRVYSGDFIAKSLVTPKDGEALAGRSTELHVPQCAENMLDDANVGADGTFTNFGLKIGMATDAKGKPSYVAEFVLEPTQTSPAETLVREHAPDILGGEKTAPAATPAPATAKKK